MSDVFQPQKVHKKKINDFQNFSVALIIHKACYLWGLRLSLKFK